MRRFLVVFAVVANLVLLDAVVKELAVGYLKGAASVVVVPGVFDLAYVENRGCAWGLLQGRVWPLAVFGLLALVFLVWKRRTVFRPSTLLSPKGAVVAECFLYAGILGNVIDRLFRGYVVDMFDFHWGVRHFPCFNVADTLICVAVGLLLLASFGKERLAGPRGAG